MTQKEREGLTGPGFWNGHTSIISGTGGRALIWKHLFNGDQNKSGLTLHVAKSRWSQKKWH